MFFRRKKQPDTDQTVLTETLRSLEDLIAEPPEPAAAGNGEAPVASASRESGADYDSHGGAAPEIPPGDSDLTADVPPVEVTTDQDLPVLTEVVFMPIPRVQTASPAIARASTAIDTAQQTIAKQLIHAVEDRLDTGDRPLDPELTQDLQQAVSASLEDWSLRTQEILLRRFTPSDRE